MLLYTTNGARAQRQVQFEPDNNPLVGMLSTEATDRDGLVLTAGDRLSVSMRPARNNRAQYWTISAVGSSMARIQLFEDGRLWSLELDRNTGKVGFARSANIAEQFWRINPSLAVPEAVRIESVGDPGYFLMGLRDGTVRISPVSSDPAQNWFFDVAPPPPAVRIPVQRIVRREVKANPPIAPVRTQLSNSHRSDLFVRVTDLRTGQPTDLTIPAGGSREFTVERDSGATYIESYQVVDPLGGTFRQEFTTAIAPTILYDVTVYEKFLQSIAIDRTGKSPNKIEDINYQPKSVGYFVIPPGTQFDDRELDVYAVAKRANNPGAARQIDPRDFLGEKTVEDPLERTLRELRDR